MNNAICTYPRRPFPEDDCLFPSLTVTETLRYAALLRLPSSVMSREEKLRVAVEVAGQLGLESCADTIIGGIFMRGVSGGSWSLVYHLSTYRGNWSLVYHFQVS
jgi:hypothetical protein